MRYSRMLDVVLSNRFKKDLKLAAKRGLDLDALNAIVDQLAAVGNRADSHNGSVGRKI